MAHHLVTQIQESEDGSTLPIVAGGQYDRPLPRRPANPPADPAPVPRSRGARFRARCFSFFARVWRRITACCQAQPPQQQQGDQQQHQAAAPPEPTELDEKKQRQVVIPTVPPHPLQKFLLEPLKPGGEHKRTLVLDLDETLVHSSFKPVPNPDFIISIELENVMHKVYVRKRPGVDHFLKAVGERYEVVIFTASLAKYADPLLDILDPKRVCSARLFRESCVLHYGNYVKDLTHLGRPLEHVVIVDNSPFSYMFQPENAIAIGTWFSDRSDRQLYELLPYLDTIFNTGDVVSAMQQNKLVFSGGSQTPATLGVGA